MNLPRRWLRWLAIGVAIVALVQLGASSYRRYLRCQAMADDYTTGEGLCRRKAIVCEELSIRLREVATLAREMAQTASGDFERSKWLKMAEVEEAKATRASHEVSELMIRADWRASRAEVFSRAAWRPWLPEPD